MTPGIDMKASQDGLERFGFIFRRGGAHLSRTMMLDELQFLLSHVDTLEAAKADYLKAIKEDNCLGKRSGETRALSARYLVELYALDPSLAIFRALIRFWRRDEEGRPLLAFLCAYARDSVLRLSTPFILNHPEGAIVNRQALEKFIDDQEPGRFSKVTLESTARNINATWTKSGHLKGCTKKIRSKAQATPGAVSYALLLGYLSGSRGVNLFKTDYAHLLDCSAERAVKLAEEASHRGWIIFKRVGDVMEVLFPKLLTVREMEWVHEQNR